MLEDFAKPSAPRYLTACLRADMHRQACVAWFCKSLLIAAPYPSVRRFDALENIGKLRRCPHAEPVLDPSVWDTRIPVDQPRHGAFCLPPVPPAHHLVDRPGIFNARVSWHKIPSITCRKTGNAKSYDNIGLTLSALTLSAPKRALTM